MPDLDQIKQAEQGRGYGDSQSIPEAPAEAGSRRSAGALPHIRKIP